MVMNSNCYDCGKRKTGDKKDQWLPEACREEGMGGTRDFWGSETLFL